MRTVYKLIYILLLGYVLFLYSTCKLTYSLNICIECIVFFFLFLFMYIKINRLNNFFCFEILFSVSFFFINFVYPVFIYPVNKTRFFSFAFGYNEDVISKATLLALLAYAIFLLGTMRKSSKKIIYVPVIEKKCNDMKIKKIIDIIVTIFLILNVIKILLLGYSTYKGNRASVIWGYISELSHGAFIATLSIKFYYLFRTGKKQMIKNIIKGDVYFWIIYLMNIIVILYSGSRTEPICMTLALMGGYYIYKGKATVKKIVAVAIIGIIGLSAVGVLRLQGTEMSFNILDLTMDLILNNYTLYVGYDYVNEQGYVLFPLIGGLIKAIPLLLGKVVAIGKIPESYVTSAQFFTNLILGDNVSLGLGTNIIASLYLSTGFIGVVVGMYILGYAIKCISSSPQYSSVYKLMIFFEMIGNSIYWVRSEFFYPVGHMVISAIWIWIIMKFNVCNNKIAE